MSAVIPISRAAAVLNQSPGPKLTARARKVAAERLELIRPMLTAVHAGASKTQVLEAWAARTGISEATGRRWLDAYADGGLSALAPQTKGRQRKSYGWEARAMNLYAQPQRPAYSTVAYWLRDEGHKSATESRVRRFLKSLPSNYAETSRKRVGAHYYDQNIRPHVVRDTSVLIPGECLEGDGHTCDVYIAHPGSGNPFRAELTVWGDVRSQRLCGWWLGEMENSYDVLYALSNAIRAEDHVPTLLHMDPGSGYVNKMLSDEALGFYSRLSITPIKTRPGNARGKGFIEGWFRWFEERCGKRFETFCGHCRTDDALSRFRQKIKRGDITLPTFLQYRDAVAEYIERDNNTPKDSLGGKTPNQVWAEGFKRNPLHLPIESLYRPHIERTVRGWKVTLFNRKYKAADLKMFEGRKVVVEYDIHDDARVWIRDRKGRLLCEAYLVERKPWIEPSVLEDRRQRAAEGQRKRLQKHLDEVNARARTPITAAALVDALEEPAESPSTGTAPALSEHSALNPTSRRAQRPAPRAVTSQARALVAELDEEQEHESPAERYARAMELEAAAEITEEDARWLAIYQTSAEYAARQLLEEEDPDAATPGSCV